MGRTFDKLLELTLPCSLSITSGVVGLLAALLVFGMSSAPGWYELRWFAACAAFAALFNLSNALVTLRVELPILLVACRLTLLFAGLHGVAWFFYTAARERRRLSRWEGALVAGGLVLSGLALVPGVLLENRLFVRHVAVLDVTYADAPPTSLGSFAFLYYGFCSLLLFVRYVHRSVRVGGETAHCIALFAVIAGSLHDSLATLGIINHPYVLDLSLLVLVLAVGGSLVSRFVASAFALEKSSRELAIAQDKLVKRERLAALGELSAVVAHEVRNPVAVVFNAVAQLRKVGPGGAEHKELLDIVQEEAERLRDTVSELLDFARPHPPLLAAAAIDDVVRGAIAAALRGAGAAAEMVESSFEEDIAPVSCDERLVHQAVVNLVANALQAVNRRRPVRVTVSSKHSYVAVVVSDDGDGIPRDLQERVFTPFFSTRPSGTGLGLAVVRRCAEAHAGTVELRTTQGGGATFELRLRREVSPSSGVIPANRMGGSSSTIPPPSMNAPSLRPLRRG